jgi:hypothetical protein
MKNTKAILLALFAAGVTVSAQTTEGEMMANINKCGSNYFAYSPEIKPYTAAPEGFVPFYISHYGRHGSRYHYSADDFKKMYGIMQRADSAEALTVLGKSVKERFGIIYKDGELKAGDLTQKGAEQHRGIAERMVKNYPEVFANGAKIDAKSSTSVRVVLSMGAFCQQLKAMNPSLNITNEASKRVMNYINFEDEKLKNNLENEEWKRRFDEMHQKLLHLERMMNALFSDSVYVQKNIDRVAFVRKFYELNSSLQGMDSLNVNFNDVWTKEELFENWRLQNMWWYGAYGSCPVTGATSPQMAKNLLKNILSEAKAAVEGGGISASLRFGHDTGLLLLAGLLQLDNCSAKVEDLESLHRHWTDFKIIPMGGNLQIIFYKNKENKVLLKVLLNENEVRLPLKSDFAPYYEWSEFEKYYGNVVSK